MSCQSAAGGKGDGTSGYEVVLEDTVLFPEGGGQVREGREIEGVRFVCSVIM